MRITFAIHTPGQAHFWRVPILMLNDRGHSVKVIARDDGLTCDILQNNGIKFSIYGNSGKTSMQKIALLPCQLWKSIAITQKFKTDIIVGVGIIEAYSAYFLNKPCIIFEDSEPTPYLERSQWIKLADVILTPDCFKLDLGKKHIRFAGYK